jgi:uncharacterized protein (TIGR03435 family)
MFTRSVVCFALVLLTATGALAQSPTFEVVSIKPAEFPSDAFRAGFLQGYGECGSTKPAISGNRVSWRIISACGIVRFAYDLPEYGVLGAPDWMTKKEQSVFYAVEAKAAGQSVTVQEAREMFRAVLAERFGLKFHRESRPLSVYELVIAKGGHKLKPPCEGQTTPVTRVAMGAAGEPAAAGTESARMQESRLAGIESCRQNLAQLVAHLTRSVDRPVIDKTGLQGDYSIKVQWSAESSPTIWTALQEQLGLKLEPSRSPVEVLVIDHAEKPSAN